jgi:hypothetical protein
MDTMFRDAGQKVVLKLCLQQDWLHTDTVVSNNPELAAHFFKVIAASVYCGMEAVAAAVSD